MYELKQLRTEMLIDQKYASGEIAKAWKSKDLKKVAIMRGKQAVVNHYLKQINRALKRCEHRV